MSSNNNKASFQEDVKQIFLNHNFKVNDFPIAGVKGWVYNASKSFVNKLQIQETAAFVYYLKGEQSEAYHNIAYEPDLAKYELWKTTRWKKGGKTINYQIFEQLKKYEPLIVFADPKNARCIPWIEFKEKGISFRQQANGELVRAIPISSLYNLDMWLWSFMPLDSGVPEGNSLWVDGMRPEDKFP